MPAARAAGGAAVLGDRVYIVGGIGENGGRKPVIGGRAVEAAGWFWVVAADVHVFTFDHWHFGPRLNGPRAGHALVQVDGRLYVIEGGVGLASGRMETLLPEP